MEGLDQLLQDPYLEEEAVRELAATRSLSTLAQVLDVIADVLSATQVGEMTVSFAIEEQVITEDIKPVEVIRSVARVLHAKQQLEDEGS